MSSLSKIYAEISEVASLLQASGWAEKNAGNFSIRIDRNSFDYNKELITEHQNLQKQTPEIANMVFLVSGKGKRMRDIAKAPEENTIIIIISNDGKSFSFSHDEDIIPTSELITHLEIHNMIAARNSSEKVVIHSHVTELIALTHIKKYCNQENLNNLLWQMHPETSMFIPQGVGFVPFALPGSTEIASSTINKLRNHQIAIWEKHGVFSIADTINNCYDLIDIAAKSAKIYFMCTNSGNHPQGLTPKQLFNLSKIDF